MLNAKMIKRQCGQAKCSKCWLLMGEARRTSCATRMLFVQFI